MLILAGPHLFESPLPTAQPFSASGSRTESQAGCEIGGGTPGVVVVVAMVVGDGVLVVVLAWVLPLVYAFIW